MNDVSEDGYAARALRALARYADSRGLTLRLLYGPHDYVQGPQPPDAAPAWYLSLMPTHGLTVRYRAATIGALLEEAVRREGVSLEPAGVGHRAASVLVRDALFLREYGERPPGAPVDPAGETWNDWEQRAEKWLRGHEGAP